MQRIEVRAAIVVLFFLAGAFCAPLYAATAPGSLTCQAAGDSVTLSWTNSEAYDSIIVRRDGTDLATLAGDATTYTDTGVAPGSYTYGVVGVVGGVASTETQCTVSLEVPPVLDLTCTGGELEVLLSWTNGSASYSSIEIQRDGTLLDTIAGSDTSYQDLSVPPGDHSYQVVAVYNSLKSTPASCTAYSSVPPLTDLSCSLTGDAVTLTWTNTFQNYDQIKVEKNGTEEALLPGDATSHTITGLDYGTYEFRVTGLLSGESSQPVSCTLSRAVPPPTDLTCTAGTSDRTVTLSWTNGTTYGSVTILRNGTPLATISGSPTSYTDTAPALGVYTYEVYGSVTTHDSDKASCTVEVSYVPPVSITQCEINTDRIAHLTWNLGGTYDAIKLEVNGTEVPGSPLPGDATSWQSEPLDPGVYTFSVIAVLSTYEAQPAVCSGTAELKPPSAFACTGAPDAWNVNLTWENGWNYESVIIERDGKPLITISGAPTSYTDQVPGLGTYLYRIYGHFNGVDSTAVTCTVEVTAVPPVTISQCEFDDTRRAHLSWTNNASSYDGIELLIDGAPAPESPLPGTATTYLSAPLGPGEHTFTLTPFIGQYKAQSQSCTPGAPLPSPSALTCTPAATSWDVSLVWTNGWVYDSVTILRDGTPIATLSGSPTSYTDTVPGIGTYTYEVYGSKAGQDSGTASCSADVTAVPPVSGVTCSAGADRVVHLSWTNGADSYDTIVILIDGVPAGDSPLPGTATSYDSQPLDPGEHTLTLQPTISTYQAQPVNCSAVSPLPPPELTCTAVAGSWNVQLSWTNSWAYSGLTLRRDGAELVQLAGTDTTYTDTVPAVGVHTYELIAHLDSLSSQAAVCSVEVSYVAPVTLTLCAIDDTRSAHLSWTNGSTPYDRIEILIDGSAAPGSPLPATSTSYDSPPLDPGPHTFSVVPAIGSYKAEPSECSGTALLPAPTAASCTLEPDSWNVTVSWENNWQYDQIILLRDGTPVATLEGSATSATDTVPTLGTYQYQIIGSLAGQNSDPASCSVEVSVVPQVKDLSCQAGEDRIIQVSWTNGASGYEGIEILLDGVLVTSPALPGDSTAYSSEVLDPGEHTIGVRPFVGAVQAALAQCTVIVPLPSPTQAECTASAESWEVQLSWTNNWTYDNLIIRRSGAEVATLQGAAAQYTDTVPGPGLYEYEIIGALGTLNSAPLSCTVEVAFVPPVTSLSCQAGENRVITASWTNGVSSYEKIEILVDGVPASDSPIAGDATSYQSVPLDPGDHTLSVVPVIGTYSAAEQACAASVPLPAPADLSCTPSLDSFEVQLSWTVSWQYGSITVLRDGVPLATLQGDSTSYTDTVPTTGVYNYSIFGSLGTLDSAAVDCTAAVTHVPALAITTCEIGEDRIAHLAWSSDTSPYDGITVLIDGQPAPGSPLPPGTMQYDSQELPPGPHTFTVQPFIGENSADPRQCEATAPLPPPSVTCTAVEGTLDVTIAWTNDWQYDTVTILRDGQEVASVPGSPESATDKVPGPGLYTYEVIAQLGDLNAQAVSCQVQVSFVPPPELKSCAVSANQVLLSWDLPMAYDSITVTRDGVELATLPGDAVSYTDELDQAGSYVYEVRASVEGIGASEPASCTADVSAAPQVVDLRCEQVGRNVELSWTNAADDYTSIEILQDGGVIAALPGDSRSYTLTSVPPGTYTFEVRALYGPLSPESVPACELTMPVWAPENLTCLAENRNVALTWTNPTIYTKFEIYRNGELLVTLGGDSTGFQETLQDFGTYEYAVIGYTSLGASAPVSCVLPVVSVLFVRGDVNGDGRVNVADPIFTLGYLFRDGPEPTCMEAANVNDDRSIDIGDVIYILGYIFRGEEPPKAPFPDCGEDPDPENSLGCSYYAPCER